MINAYHMEGSETYCLELTKLRMQELLEQCDNDYNILVSKLKIFRGKLLLRVYNGSRVSPISSGARTPIVIFKKRTSALFYDLTSKLMESRLTSNKSARTAF